MSKRKYGQRSSFSVLREIDRIVNSSSDENDRRTAERLRRKYVLDGRWGAMSKREAAALTSKYKKPTQYRPHYLYAVTDGDRIKVGFSSDVGARLKDLQTGCPGALRVVWTCYCAESRGEARTQERKLHRAISRFRSRGEWHDKACMAVVSSWEVRNRDAEENRRGEAAHDRLDRDCARAIESER